MKADGTPFITVYAISKNEAKFAEKWAKNMSEADAVVVLDTGSADGTAEILRENGVKVEVKEIRPWRFDEARNESLKLCPPETDLFVCTDLDEEFTEGWAAAVREAYEPGYDRYYYLYSTTENASGIADKDYWYDKMHSGEYRWRYPVHEQLYLPEGHAPERGKYIAAEKIHLYHHPDTTKSRGQYFDLLELRDKENPTDWHGKMFLAGEYWSHGMIDKCIAKINEILEMDAGKFATDHPEEAGCYSYLGGCYKALGDYDKAIYYYNKMADLVPTYRAPYLNLAETYLDLRDYEKAVAALKKALSLQTEVKSWLESTGAWGTLPYDLLCRAYWYGGDHVKAIACAAKALSGDPKNERLKQNLDVCIELTKDTEW